MDYRFMVLGILLGLVATLHGAAEKLQKEEETKKAKDQNDFLMAAFKGETQKVDDYIKQGINVDAQEKLGHTAAHLAVLGVKKEKNDSINHCIHIIKALISAKANMGLKDRRGETALYKAQKRKLPKRLLAALNPARTKSAPNMNLPKDFFETKED